MKWFKEKISQEDCDVEDLKWLARGPNFDVITWIGYDINMLSFYTKAEDDKSTMQNIVSLTGKEKESSSYPTKKCYSLQTFSRRI